MGPQVAVRPSVTCECVSYIQLCNFIFTCPSTAGVVGALRMTSQPVSSIFLCSPLPSRTWRTQGLSIPWCCLLTSSFVCLVFLSSSHFRCALQNGLARPYERETSPYHFSLCLLKMVRRSSCGSIACCILAQISLLATWFSFEMHSILQ